MAETSELKQNFLDSCLNGRVEDVLKYLERGVNVNITDTLGRTALMLACLQPNNTAIIQILLQNDANVYALDNEGNSALDYARQNNNTEAEMLLRQSHPENKEETQKTTADLKNYDPSIAHYNPKTENSNAQIEELLRKKALETIIEVCDEFKSLEGEQRPFIYFKKSEALFQLGRKEEAVKVLHISKQIFEDTFGDFEMARSWSNEVVDLYLKIIAIQADLSKKDYEKALWLYNEAYLLSNEPEQKYEFKQMRDETYSQMVRSFHYKHQKKVAIVGKDLPTFEPSLTLALQSDDLGNLEFPEGAPQANGVYVAHPYQPRLFYPYEDALHLLFNAQLNELINIVQSLGATNIKIEYLQGNRHIELAQDPVFGENDAKEEKSQNKTFVVEHSFTPTQKVHLPHQLLWYNHRPEWQNLAKQRLDGSLKQIEMIVSTDNMVVLSDFEIEEIEQEIQEILSFGFKGGKEKAKRGRKSSKQSNENQFSFESFGKNPITCKVSIEFETKEKLVEEVSSNMFTNFKIEVPRFTETRDSLEDDAVDKKKTKNNLFEKQPEESIEYSGNSIEQKQPSHSKSVRQSVLTDDVVEKKEAQEEKKETETIKVEEKKEEVKDEAKRERDLELKDVDMKQNFEKKDEEMPTGMSELTQEERYYYEMLQRAYQDGNISDDVRKVLERRRSRFKISEERAKEIERIMLERK